jgi:4-hydroxyphenylpyruvate dioxygenase
MGTDGFEFVEFTAPQPAELERVFAAMGFRQVGRHRSKAVTLWRQGEINFILNAEQAGPAAEFARRHGPSANAMAFRVKDAAYAYARALELGAKPYATRPGAMELNIPAIEGVGGSALYLVDRYGPQTIYDVDFYMADDPVVEGVGLKRIDHLTHNLRAGEMDAWYGFYARLFNFREIRFFDIEGRVTGLRSRALASPDGAIRIPLNEGAGGEQLDQIEEFLQVFNGEGIQHIALATDDIFATVRDLRDHDLRFMEAPPAAYYEMLGERLPDHGEDLRALRQYGLLVDGSPGKRLLQIFSEPTIGPVFFEIIQRKGDEGFGAGNFKALFESIEQDQIRRGVVTA